MVADILSLTNAEERNYHFPWVPGLKKVTWVKHMKHNELKKLIVYLRSFIAMDGQTALMLITRVNAAHYFCSYCWQLLFLLLITFANGRSPGHVTGAHTGSDKLKGKY